MATDGPTPQAYDAEIYERGKLVVIFYYAPPNAIETFVRALAVESGQRVDWHYVAGQGLVKALGDLAKVRAALDRRGNEFAALEEAGLNFRMDPKRFQRDLDAAVATISGPALVRKPPTAGVTESGIDLPEPGTTEWALAHADRCENGPRTTCESFARGVVILLMLAAVAGLAVVYGPTLLKFIAPVVQKWKP